jgi:hypothetical protein
MYCPVQPSLQKQKGGATTCISAEATSLMNLLTGSAKLFNYIDYWQLVTMIDYQCQAGTKPYDSWYTYGGCCAAAKKHRRLGQQRQHH